MDSIEIFGLAREIGVAIQSSEEYINYRMNEQAVECNKELQDAIGNFNLKKVEINNELSKDNVDQEKLDKLNKEIGELYRKINDDETMKKFNTTKQVFDDLLNKISYVISECAKGEDPYKVQIPDEDACTGSCATCGGCH